MTPDCSEQTHANRHTQTKRRTTVTAMTGQKLEVRGRKRKNARANHSRPVQKQALQQEHRQLQLRARARARKHKHTNTYPNSVGTKCGRSAHPVIGRHLHATQRHDAARAHVTLSGHRAVCCTQCAVPLHGVVAREREGGRMDRPRVPPSLSTSSQSIPREI